MKKIRNIILFLLFAGLSLVCICYGSGLTQFVSFPELTKSIKSFTGTSDTGEAIQANPIDSSYLRAYAEIEIPVFQGTAQVVLNNNVPWFTEEDMTTDSYEFYSELDGLGRCQAAMCCLGTDLMPDTERGEIGPVKPTGWQTKKYDFIDGKYLYNRCHLVAYYLTGENDNEKNLITGTRYLNIEGMYPYECRVIDYVKDTGNHCMYRVTPIFEGSELVARGVLMEAKSVEDDGAGICFNVYCYNVQPGVSIDYTSGDNEADGTIAVSGSSLEDSGSASSAGSDDSSDTSAEAGDEQIEIPEGTTYVVNTNSLKFHLPTCECVEKMSERNRSYKECTREELIEEGYEPCKVCNP